MEEEKEPDVSSSRAEADGEQIHIATETLAVSLPMYLPLCKNHIM